MVRGRFLTLGKTHGLTSGHSVINELIESFIIDIFAELDENGGERPLDIPETVNLKHSGRLKFH